MVGKYTGLSDSYLSVLKVNVLFIENIVYPSAAFFILYFFKIKLMQETKGSCLTNWMYYAFFAYYCLSFTLLICILYL